MQRLLAIGPTAAGDLPASPNTRRRPRSGDLLRLADREVMAPLDADARRQILKSAKRVATVTAISPMAWIGMLFVAVENMRMLRALATLYGGRPGLTGTMRPRRLVIGHIVATAASP